MLWQSHRDETAKLWDIRKGRCIQQLEGYGVYPIAFSSNSLLCMTNYDDRTTKIWEVDSKNCLSTFMMSNNARWDPHEFSPDGQYVLSYSATISEQIVSEETTHLWNTITGQSIALEGISGRAIAGCFFPNGDKCMLFFNDGILKVWSIKTGKCIKVLRIRNKTNRYLSAIASPDEKYILLFSTAETWSVILNIETGRYSPLKIQGNKLINSAIFAPDGKHFILTINTEVMLYKLENDNPIFIGSFQNPIDDKYWTEYTYPYWLIHKHSHIELYRQDYFECREPKSIDYIGSLYIVDGLFVSNCSFTDVSADDDVKMILYQYGAKIDSFN